MKPTPTGRSTRRLLSTLLVLLAGPAAAQVPNLQVKPQAHISAVSATTPEYPRTAFQAPPSPGNPAIVLNQQAPAPGRLRVSLTDPLRLGGSFTVTSPVTVTFTAGGTASAGSDYFSLSGQVTIPAGASSADILVYAAQDGLFEGDETVGVTLTASSGVYTLGGGASSASATIKDMDNRVSITAQVPSIGEGAGIKVTALVSRTGGTQSALEVPFAVSGTATKDVDYDISASPVTIPAGATSAIIRVGSRPDKDTEGPETVTITLSPSTTHGVGTPGSATIVIDEDLVPVVTLFSLAPASATGGSSVTGRLTLNGPAPAGGLTVPLSSSDAAATVPPSVVVPAGQNQVPFTIRSAPVAADTPVTLTAATGQVGGAKTAALVVVPPAPASLAFNPATVTGGSDTVATLTLTGAPVPPGLTAQLQASSALITVQESVTIAGGVTAKSFTVSTRAVASDTPVSLRARHGSQGADGGFTVQAPRIATLTIAPAAVPGGSPATASFTLTGPTAIAPTTVHLASSSPAATVPANATVGSHGSGGTFAISTSAVALAATATITATLNGTPKSATFAVHPPAVASLSLSPATVASGGSTTATVTLDGPAPAGGFTVPIRSGSSAATVPTSVTFSAGAREKRDVPVIAAHVTSDTVVAVFAGPPGAEASAYLTITKP